MIIKENLGLLEIDGTILPLLSEEGKSIPYEERKNWKKYWLIDPLDGTKEFIKKNGEFIVNIALIENGIPSAGFVYIPVHDLLYFGIEGFGSFRIENASKRTGTRIIDSSKKMSIDKNIDGPIRVVASRSHMSTETEAFILRLRNMVGEIEMTSSGSSIKLCMVAILNFTGISAPYDDPVDAELVVDTDKMSILDGVELVSALERNH